MGEKNSSKEKTSSWERISSISVLLIALIGAIATFVYNQKQSELQEIEAVRGFFKHLISENKKEHELASIALKELTNKELAARLIETAIPSEDRRANVVAKFGTKEVLDIIQEGSNPDNVRSTARKAFDKISAAKVYKVDDSDIKPPETPGVSTTEKRKGWAYLGTYDAKDQHWETRYFDFNLNIDPKTFIGKTLKVRNKTGALNVRNSMPNEWARFGRIIDVLKPGTEVEIKEVKAWSSTGYMWAQIVY